MESFVPSFEEYRKILRDLKKSGKYMDFADAQNAEKFVVLRHDIEFSIDRAYEMSKVESEEGINSTFFVQITNNSYNAFSKKNVDLIHDMAARGHHIGLHYHLNGQRDEISVRDGVRDQLRIMSEMLGMSIDRYSFHRPVKEVYYYRIAIPYTINAYAPAFFTYADTVNQDTPLDVKYIADSKHRWNYGYPDYETLMKFDKVQILVHPFSWTKTGYDNFGNFLSLIEEKDAELIDTLHNEFQRFQEVQDEIIRARKSREW